MSETMMALNVNELLERLVDVADEVNKLIARKRLEGERLKGVEAIAVLRMVRNVGLSRTGMNLADIEVLESAIDRILSPERRVHNA